jgi:hypothetical protein
VSRVLRNPGRFMELSRNRFTNQEAFVSHPNAGLTPRTRLLLALLIVEDGWQPYVAAKMFMVSVPTARTWAARFKAERIAGMQDRSSCPARDRTRRRRQVVVLQQHATDPHVRGQLILSEPTSAPLSAGRCSAMRSVPGVIWMPPCRRSARGTPAGRDTDRRPGDREVRRQRHLGHVELLVPNHPEGNLSGPRTR